MTTMMALALLMSATPPQPPPPAESAWEPDCCWARLNAELSLRRLNEPSHLDFRVVDIAFSRGDGRYALELPFLGLGWDLRRPNGARGSATLSFVQDPLLLLLSIPFLDKRAGEVPRYVAGAILWLAGGTFYWTPGGTGNLARAPAKASSLALVVRSRFDAVVFGGPDYLRQTVSLGVAFHRDEIPFWTKHFMPDWGCSLGILASAAAGRAGARSFDPGLWATCGVWYLPVQ